jgi:CubicO group peptidase (beta-lactamase class C family)
MQHSEQSTDTSMPFEQTWHRRQFPGTCFIAACLMWHAVSTPWPAFPRAAAAEKSTTRLTSHASAPEGLADPARAMAARIDEFVRDEMAKQRVPGVAIAIVNKGQITTRGYGYANLEHRIPVTEETIFQSGSVGKMFTATAVMLLVEDRKVALDDPITKFFPDAPANWRDITVRHLLNHTSGIPDYTTSTFDYRKDYTEDDLASFAYEQPPEFAAGSRWNYSNTGYALLGFIIRKASGQFYGDVLDERVFKLLDMTTARIISEADIVPNRAAGYRIVKDQINNQDWVAPRLNTTADGSLYWSLRDLLAWDAAVKKRAILKPESWHQILAPARLNSGKTYPYGMGWSLDERGGKPLQHHGGAWQGFQAKFSRFLGDDLDIIVLANLAEANPARFVDGIAAIIHPHLAVKTPGPIDDSEPNVAPRLTELLEKVRSGNLAPSDFAFVRAGFFPNRANAYRIALEKLGAPMRMQLLERIERGDDRLYLYQLTFAVEKRYLRVGLAPDDKVSVFSIAQQP